MLTSSNVQKKARKNTILKKMSPEQKASAANSKAKETVEKITSLDTLCEFLQRHDNSENIYHASDIPEVCKEYPCILGIDEAGRGPVLGPMVYGTSYCPLNIATTPDSLGCDDSKALTEKRRDEIFTSICETKAKMGWAVEVIAPQTISNCMLRRSKYSLNQVSMDAAIKLIRGARDAGVKIKHVYVDTVGPPDKYQAYLKSLFPEYSIKVEKKADSTYPIVSAASICAKVVRDHALKVWRFEKGAAERSIGSGYPGDPTTKSYLRESCDPVFGFSKLVRSSWSTASDLLEKEAYYVEWPEEDEEEDDRSTPSVASFFKIDKCVTKKEHDFFTSRGLSRKVEF